LANDFERFVTSTIEAPVLVSDMITHFSFVKFLGNSLCHVPEVSLSDLEALQ
jgi:hypothetical protein